MMYYNYQPSLCDGPEIAFMVLIGALLVWTLFWKGASMWHAARRHEGVWFVILLLFNTVGILDMIYLFGVAKIKSNDFLK